VEQLVQSDYLSVSHLTQQRQCRPSQQPTTEIALTSIFHLRKVKDFSIVTCMSSSEPYNPGAVSNYRSINGAFIHNHREKVLQTEVKKWIRSLNRQPRQCYTPQLTQYLQSQINRKYKQKFLLLNRDSHRLLRGHFITVDETESIFSTCYFS
jgi:hypothetical protein